MKQKTKLILVVSLTVILLVAGCVSADTPKAAPHIKVEWSERWQTMNGEYSHTLSKITIAEDNVTCYITSGYYADSPACFKSTEVTK